LAGNRHWIQITNHSAVDAYTNQKLAVPFTVPQPNAYDFPAESNRTFAYSWLMSPNEGGAVAFFGETDVLEDFHGRDLATRMLFQYTHGMRTLGDSWKYGQQQYWMDFRTDEAVFHSLRIFLSIMTFFGDPSLRIN